MKQFLITACFLCCAFQACNTTLKPDEKDHVSGTKEILNSAEQKPVHPVMWTSQLRGASAGTNLTREDIRVFSEYGGDLLRVAMASNPMMDLEPPYEMNEEAWVYLDSVLHWSEECGVKVIIDPHRYPGMEFPWTMLDIDPFWRNTAYHDILVDFWVKLAKKYADGDHAIAAYDLLNEPALGVVSEGGWDINPLYERLIRAIREVDSIHTISIAAPRYKSADQKAIGYAKGIQLLKKFDDPNLVYQIHFYNPQDFTHQGVFGRKTNPSYPGMISGEQWDKEKIAEMLEPTKKFADSLGVHIILGEFSVPRWVPTGDLYLRDVIDYCEKEGWSWCYHAWRENQIWDAEMNPENIADSLTRYSSTPRLELLKKYYKK